jgi:hypothetical protein
MFPKSKSPSPLAMGLFPKNSNANQVAVSPARDTVVTLQQQVHMFWRITVMERKYTLVDSGVKVNLHMNASVHAVLTIQYNQPSQVSDEFQNGPDSFLFRKHAALALRW